MNYIDNYLNNVIAILNTQKEKHRNTLEEAAKQMADAVVRGNKIFAFGCSHAGLLALELYYRTGGLALINPVRAPGLNCDFDPATATSKIERLEDYGCIIADSQPINRGDVVIVHSVSGRNTVTVDFAISAKQKGAFIIALTSLAYSQSVTSRHKSGKRLFEVADLVVDNGGCVGDASVEVEGVPQKVGPTSTAVGAALLNAIVVQAVSLIEQAGKTPPIFMSANLDGGDEYNKKMLKAYRKSILYMGTID